MHCMNVSNRQITLFFCPPSDFNGYLVLSLTKCPNPVSYNLHTRYQIKKIPSSSKEAKVTTSNVLALGWTWSNATFCCSYEHSLVPSSFLLNGLTNSRTNKWQQDSKQSLVYNQINLPRLKPNMWGPNPLNHRNIWGQ